MSIHWDAVSADHHVYVSHNANRESEIFSIIEARFGIPAAQAKKIWKQLRPMHGIKWDLGKHLISKEQLDKVDHVFRTYVQHLGRTEERTSSTRAGVLANYLLCKTSSLEVDHPNCPRLRRPKLRDAWRAIFVKRDPKLLAEFRNHLQAAINESDDDAFIHNVLSLYAFTYPEEGQQITIKGKNYRIDKKLQLTPKWFSSPIPAYGILSDENEADPILIFLGSTYPAGEGFIATWLGDCTPFQSVGKVASRSADITDWLEGKQNVTATGVSLGGALSLHAYKHPQVNRVFAYNPAGLYPCDFCVSEGEVNIYSQWNDLVSTMGHFPKGANVWRVIKEGEDESFILAHARAYTGMAHTRVKSSVRYEHSRPVRAILTLTHMVASPIIFTLCLLLYGMQTLLKKIYKTFSLSYLDDKKHTSSRDKVLTVGLLILGTFVLTIALYSFTHTRSLPVRGLLQDLGKKGFNGIMGATVTLGMLTALGSIRSIPRHYRSKAREVRFIRVGLEGEVVGI